MKHVCTPIAKKYVYKIQIATSVRGDCKYVWMLVAKKISDDDQITDIAKKDE